MPYPKPIQKVLCRAANATGIDRLHDWNRPHKHRAGGFLFTRRRCSACKVTQERQIPGGGWVTLPPEKRVRKSKLHLQTEPEEQRSDLERRLGPL